MTTTRANGVITDTNGRLSDSKNGGDLAAPLRTAIFGAALGGSLVEAVVSPTQVGRLDLHIRKGTRFATLPQIELEGKIYVPAMCGVGLSRAVRFPPPSARYDSDEQLAASVSDFLFNFGNTTREEADLLAAFALSTWFVDCFPRAPSLHLTGPSARVHWLMRLLTCVCRRAVLLGRLDLAALSTLPEGLGATLLVGDEKLAPNFRHILHTARTRELRIPFAKDWLYLYGATVLFSTPSSIAAPAIRVHLAPTTGTASADEIEEKMVNDFQAKLLRLRMLRFNAVRKSNLNCPDFHPQMQDDVSALITPLMECADLKNSVLSSLRSQSTEVSGERFTDSTCVVIEAALCYCHDSGVQTFFVKELTDAVNAILIGRHEERILSSRMVGSVLRELGLFAERATRGYHVNLSNSNREKIHLLAKQYEVASVSEGSARCNFCL